MPVYRPAAAALFLLGLSACDVVAPQRAFNDAAQPPRVIAFDAFEPGLEYAGDVFVGVDRALSQTPFATASLFVDGQPVGACAPPCQIGLGTSAYADGPHVLSLALNATGRPDPTVGLGALLGLGAVVLRDTVVFDQAPPVPVRITETEWTDAGVRVRWETPGGGNRNARTYNVTALRFGEQVGPTLIVAAPATEVLDTAHPRRIGDLLTYVVYVTNGATNSTLDPIYAEPSAPVAAVASFPLTRTPECPDDAPGGAAEAAAYASVPGTDRILALCTTGLSTPRLRRYSAATRSASDAVPLSVPSGFSYDVVASPGGAFALVGSRWASPRVIVAALDPETLQPGPFTDLQLPSGSTGEFPFSPSLLDGQGRIFLPAPDGSVLAFDRTTGELLQAFAGGRTPDGFAGSGALAQPALDRLVFVGFERMLGIDASARPARVTAERVIADHLMPTQYAADASGHLYRIAGRSRFIDVLDPATLTVQRSIVVAGAESLGSIRGDVDGVYVYGSRPDGSGDLSRYASSGTLLGRRPVVSLVGDLLPTATPGEFFLGGLNFPYLDRISP